LVSQQKALTLAVEYVKDLEGTASSERILEFPQIASKVAMSALQTNTFDSVVPIIVAFSEITSSVADDFGNVGAEIEGIS